MSCLFWAFRWNRRAIKRRAPALAHIAAKVHQEIADAIGCFVRPPPDLFVGELSQAFDDARQKALLESRAPLTHTDFREFRIAQGSASCPTTLLHGPSRTPFPLRLRSLFLWRHRAQLARKRIDLRAPRAQSPLPLCRCLNRTNHNPTPLTIDELVIPRVRTSATRRTLRHSKVNPGETPGSGTKSPPSASDLTSSGFPLQGTRLQARPKPGCIPLCRAGYVYEASPRMRLLQRPSFAFAS